MVALAALNVAVPKISSRDVGKTCRLIQPEWALLS